MAELLAALLAAHLVGDFVLQTDWVIRTKRKPAVLVLHVVLITALSALFSGALVWPLLAAVFVSHLVMDAIKVHVLKDTLRAFLIDQGVHGVVLVVLAFVFHDAFARGLWPSLLGRDAAYLAVGLAALAGFIACVFMGGHLIRLATAPLAAQIEEGAFKGLSNGGLYIGWLERALVFLLVLAGELTAIGFLIAAKSILRFGDIRTSSERQVAEYVIIGTFMSFGWALLVSYAARAGLMQLLS